MSLRDKVIEAMADAWKDARQSPIINEGAAAHALDALLDTLEANAEMVWDTDDVWQQEIYRKNEGTFLVVSLAELREGEQP